MSSVPDEDPVQILTRALHTDDATVRQQAALELAKIGSTHEMVVPALIQALQDQDPAVRLSVANALGQIGAPAVPFLIDALQTEQGELRRLVVVILGRFGPTARVAVPFLVDLQSDEEIATDVDEAIIRIHQGQRAVFDRYVKVFLQWGPYGLIVMYAVIGVSLWLRANLLHPERSAGAATAFAWAVIGACLGVIVGLGKQGRWGALLGATVPGCGGAVTGLLAGTIFGNIFRTVASLLAQP
jgi:hypothetical protein